MTLPAQYAHLATTEFGDSPELSAQLIALILNGKKTATCGALRSYLAESEALPVVGQQYVVLDFHKKPAAVIETTEIVLQKFCDVSEDFAVAEGEGDFKAWREGHVAYFERNGGWSEDLDLVCERFRLVQALTEKVTFIVTDIETDGHSPLRNSMLSFASIAVDYDGNKLGEFETVLERRVDRQPDPKTTEWWQGFPDAYKAATDNPKPIKQEMLRFADWIESLPGEKVFCAAPIMFDGPWMDHYLDVYADTRALGGPFTGRQLFRGGGVCLYTMAGALRGQDYLNWGMQRAPTSWYGDIPHSHKAIDDARGFANVLVKLFQLNGQLPKIENTTGAY